MDIKKLARIADDSVESREIIKALTKLKELGYKVARVSNNLIISYGTIEMRLRLLTGDYTVKSRNGDLKGTLDVGGKSFAFNLMKILKRLIYDERVSDSIDTDLLLTIVEAQLKHYNLDANYSARKIGNKVSVKNSSGVEQGSIWEDNDEIKTQFNASTDSQVKTALEEISQLGPNVVKDKDGKVKEAFKESYSKITGALKGIATSVSKEVGKDIKENAVAIAGPIGVIANELYKAGKSGMRGKKSDSFSIHICDAMSSSVLKDKIKALGLDPDGKSVKEMEQVIAMALWAQNHPGEEFPDQFDPMLAKDSTKATKDWINENFKDTDWILQEKINGMRSILTINGDKVRMTSRSKSVSDFLFTPHQDSVLGFQDIKNPFKGKTVLDGELFSKRTKIDTGQTVTESPLQAVVALVHMNAKESLEIQEKYNGPLVYKCFDILYFNGDDVQDLPYEERDKLAGTAIEMLRHDNPDLPIQKVDSVTSYKSAWEIFQNYIKEGKEGVMMKKRSMKYKQGNRSSEMQKLKGFVTVDGFITGAVKSSEGKGFKDLIGGFKISAYVDGKEQEIAAVSNIPNSVRKEATVMVDGKPTLNPEYLDKCVELIGQEFGKNKRLGSARINEWRPDKDPMDCQLTEADVTPKDWEKNDVKDSKVADSKIFDASIDVDNVVAEVMTKWINSGHTNDITTNSNYPFLKFNLPPHNGVVEVNFEDQTVNLSKDYKAEGDFGELYVIVKESVDDVLQIEPDYQPLIQMSDSFDMEFFTDFLNTNWNGPKLKFREDDNVIKVGFEKYEPFIFEYDAEEKKFTDLKSINSIASMKLIEMAQNHLNPISDSLEDVQDQAIYLIDWLKSIGELSMTFDMDYEDIFVNSSSKNYNAVLQRLNQLDLIYEILDDGTIKITLPIFSTAEYEGVYDSDEKYSVKKVNNTKYEVLKDGEHTYDLEKKGSKWTCSCTGFKYRGKCKHLNLLDEELPKRHPRKELDDLVPEIKEMFKDYPTWEIVGSYRRGKSDFKDIDILVETDSSEFKKIEDILQQDPEYKRTMAGPDIIRGTYHGYDFDVSRVEPGEWGSYLLYRTGCFVGDTKVLTPNGIKLIKDIEVGDDVFSGKGEIVKVLATSVKRRDKFIKFKSRGSEIICTEDHKILVSGNGTQGKKYNEPRWQRADSLGRYCSLFYPFIKFPKSGLNPSRREAFLLGLYLSDGNLHAREATGDKKHNQSEDYLVRIEDGLVSYENRISIDIRKLEEYKILFEDYKIPIYDARGGRENEGTIFIKDRKLNEFCLKYGGVTYEKRGLNKFLNKEVLGWSDEIQKEVLKGFFLGDGTFSRGDFFTPRFLNKNYQIIEALYLLTKQFYQCFGIKSYKDGMHSFTIVGEEAKRMYDEMLIDTELLKGVKCESFSKNPVYLNSFEGVEGYQKILRGKPESIEIEDMEVYDIEVDDSTHSFLIEDGFVVHNSADFNIKLRGWLKAKGMKLNEHGIYDKEGNLLANKTEEDMFKAMGLPYIPPEEREKGKFEKYFKK